MGAGAGAGAGTTGGTAAVAEGSSKHFKVVPGTALRSSVTSFVRLVGAPFPVPEVTAVAGGGTALAVLAPASPPTAVAA